MKTQLVTLFTATLLLGNFARAQQVLSCLTTSGTAPGIGFTARGAGAGGGLRERFAQTETSAVGAGGKVHADRSSSEGRGNWIAGPVEVPEYYIPRPHDSRRTESVDDWFESRSDRNRDFSAAPFSSLDELRSYS